MVGRIWGKFGEFYAKNGRWDRARSELEQVVQVTIATGIAVATVAPQ